MGKRLKLARKRKNLTQQTLGDQVGVTKQAVYLWETDKARPDTTHLMPLRRALEVPVSWLLEGGGDPPPLDFTARLALLKPAERAAVEAVISSFVKKREKSA